MRSPGASECRISNTQLANTALPLTSQRRLELGNRASDLILRTRPFPGRALRGDIDRGLINHFAKVGILSRYVARASYARLLAAHFDSVKTELVQALIDFDKT
jgi:hypothetical protein